MKNISSGHFYNKLNKKKEFHPLNGQIELTYRCNLNCVHCYCNGLEDKELNTLQWKKIIDNIRDEGCIWLIFTGGDPLMRNDFLELYAYAKKMGFIITIFTNGQRLIGKTLDYLTKFPPHCIEITLNGITKDTYEAITQVEGSFFNVLQNIKTLAKRKLPLILKTNCLKQNKDELGKIKAFTEKVIGKPPHSYYFKYDPMIYPRLNGDRAPCEYRLSFKETAEIAKQDTDIWKEFEHNLHRGLPDFNRDRSFLYRCTTWMTNFFINPYGRLKFCALSDKFSVELKTNSFKKGFYEVFPRILDEKFKTNSKCKKCSLRAVCYQCPARAYLETGDEEAPVPYYCELAKATAREMKRAQGGLLQ